MRVAGELAMPVCVIPSAKRSVHGAVPVNVTVMFAEADGQVTAPVATAVGGVATVTVALPEELPVPFASEIAVIV